ncbi:MAG: metallophosphoesterase, partial [Chloroflexota bacterium]
MSTRGVSLSLVQFPHSKWYQDADEVYVFIGDVTKQPVYHVEASASVKNRLQARDKALEKTFLRILHLNDLHGNIAALNRDGPSTNHFSNLYSHIKMRRESEMTDSQKGLLVFSGGDELGGSPLEQLWIETGVHAVYQLYNQIGLSAATLGNHDFDLGAEELARAITMYARFPILTANIIAEGELAACLFPAAIFNLDGLRVGVIGITLANRHKNASNYQITDPAAAVNHLLPALAEWSDVIVILSHAGYTLEGDIGLANAIPIGSADLIVGGHTHSEIAPNRGTGEHIVNGIPIVQAGSNAQVIGDCTFKILPQTGRARFQNETLVPTSDLEEDIKFSKAFVLPCVDLLQKMLRRPLG